MYTNKYVMDKKLVKEYIYEYILKKVLIYGYLISIFGITISILANKYILSTMSFGLICILVITPIIFVKKMIASEKELHNGKLQETVITFGKNIVMNEGKSHLHFLWRLKARIYLLYLRA